MEEVVYLPCQVRNPATPACSPAENGGTGSDLCSFSQFLVAEGILPPVGDMLYELHCPGAVPDNRIFLCRRIVVQPMEDGRKGSVRLRDAPLADRDAGKVRLFKADRDNIGIDNGRTGRKHGRSFQFEAEDRVIGLGLVPVVCTHHV
ncbi:MAG TPA: hypothetical protein VHN82_05290, partial [Methanoregula sp.]|nr:hypothetical protein [Methanoregula sp.]